VARLDQQAVLWDAGGETVRQLLNWQDPAEITAKLRRKAQAAAVKRGNLASRLARFAALLLLCGALLAGGLYFMTDLLKRNGDQAKSVAPGFQPAAQPVSKGPTSGAPPAPVAARQGAMAQTGLPVEPVKDAKKDAPGSQSLAAIRSAPDMPVELPSGHWISRGKVGHTIQVASYNKISEANAHAERLKAAGIQARVVRAEVPNRGTWYRVQAGFFTSEEEAMRYGAQLRARGMVHDFLVTRFQAQQ
jgi:cell division septation protein DedD